MSDDDPLDDAQGLWRRSDPDTSREAALRARREYHWLVARRILGALLIDFPAVSARMVREVAAQEGFNASEADSIRRRVHQKYEEGYLICVGKDHHLGGMLFIFRSPRSKRPPKPPRSKKPPPQVE